MRRILLIFLCFVTLCAAAPRRSKSDINKRMQETEQKISDTRKEIKANSKKTERELANLQQLQASLRKENKVASRLRTRLDTLQSTSRRLGDSIASTQTRLESLRQSYAKALIAARKQRQSASATAFLVSSETFTQARSRVRYLNELAAWQSDKARALREAQSLLSARQHRYDSVQNVVRHNVDSVAAIERNIDAKKQKASTLVASLKKQGKNLNAILAQQQKLARDLDRELNRIIEQEAKEAARKAAAEEAARRKAEQAREKEKKDEKKEEERPSKATPTPSKPAPSKPAPTVDTKQSSSFAKSRGALRRPIDRSSSVASNFGINEHKEYSKVVVNNNGVDFHAPLGANAVAVYPGVVSTIVVMPGYKNVVLVRHGEYLTVYAGIENLSVSKGQQVAAGQTLGSIVAYPGLDNTSRLHFEIRREKEKLNPADWLAQ